MNKRQKKKAFKKKFGYNPKDIDKKVMEALPDFVRSVSEAVTESVNALNKVIPEILNAAIKLLNENMETIKELQRRTTNEKERFDRTE